MASSPYTCPLDLRFDLDQALTGLDLDFPPSRAEAKAAAVEAVAAMADGGGDGAATCAVCMEAVEVGKRTPCRHVYHADCISAWLSLGGGGGGDGGGGGELK
ncbi:E3 ubiquitin ligase BIG BROTHER [Acorus gramineus]|uniref:E3 ubiquitin ligase BIG BROTHER n=1 Tax=Acorus gramineus TaxID=55184 RepID=A0AAV8ZZK7_ACOGR|nr:E3 ubiquitin ligase BIG BROTHER [Acorus gramineus]